MLKTAFVVLLVLWILNILNWHAVAIFFYVIMIVSMLKRLWNLTAPLTFRLARRKT